MISEWSRANRHTTIGSSDVPVILGLVPQTNAADLWLQKKRRTREFTGNEATKLGEVMEPIMVDWALERLSLVRLMRDVECVSAADPMYIANLDAIGELPNGGGELNVEAKSTGLVGPLKYEEWGPEGTDMVPPKVIAQTHFQMFCRGPDCTKTCVAAMLGGRGRQLFWVQRDEEFVAKMMSHVEEFKRAMQSDTPPNMAPTLDVLEQLRRREGHITEVPDEKMMVLASLKATKKIAEEGIKKALEEIISYDHEAEIFRSPNGCRLTYKSQHRNAYQVRASDFRVARFTLGTGVEA